MFWQSSKGKTIRDPGRCEPADLCLFRLACGSTSARTWPDERLDGIAPVALSWASLLAFIRITTNHRAFRLPASIVAAWRRWTARPYGIPVPGANHRAVLGRLLRSGDASANLVQDAHLAALAIENGLILYSTDSDFARSYDLRWENPLRGG